MSRQREMVTRQDPWNRIRLFDERDPKTAYRCNLSPWKRDVAQDIDRCLPLIDRIGRNAGVLLDRDQASTYRSPR